MAVDAGTLLSGIIRTLDQYITISEEGKGLMNEGPFLGLDLPHATAQANAAFIFREIIASVLITHPHLDHLSGLAINTPIVEASNGPKTVAALPSVVSAMKNHMFNDIIWPNLSDEDGGAGLITYQRLVEGGNPRFGRGDSRGYVRACEGLVTKCLGVSHGRCKKRYHAETGRHHRIGSAVFSPDSMMVQSRTLPVDPSDGRYEGSRAKSVLRVLTELFASCSIYSPGRSPRLGSHMSAASANDNAWAVVESSAFFILDGATGSEIIVFGDIEPDSISLEPRNKRVWEIAAPKVAAGSLRAIFIECSFNDSVDDGSLYGHLCPRHLIAELKILASEVVDADQPHRRGRSSKRKRKDSDSVYESHEQISPRSIRSLPHLPGRTNTTGASPVSGRSATRSRINSGDGNLGDLPELVHDDRTPSVAEPADVGGDGSDTDEVNTQRSAPWGGSRTPPPLAGLSIYIIHIKDTLTDGPHPSERILAELRTQSEQAGLGCQFFVPKQGEGIWI